MGVAAPIDPVTAFVGAMASHGLASSSMAIIADGKLHRFDVPGDGKGSKNGFYVLHLDERPAGMFGSWKSGIKETWKSDGPALTDFEREKLLREIRRAEQRRAREEERRHAETAVIAQDLWDGYEEAPADHPYLQRKSIKTHGARVDGDGRLVVPLRDADGKIWSLETIDRDGKKLFLPGGRKKGLFFWIGSGGKSLVIAEGFATAASIYEATGTRVAVAFDAGNLTPVAEAIRAADPAPYIVVAADNDCETHAPPIENPGLHYARQAAAAAGGTVAVPEWPEPSGKKLDFNDLALADGPETVARIILDAFDAQQDFSPIEPANDVAAPQYDSDPCEVIRMQGGSLDENSTQAETVIGAHTRSFPFEGIYRVGLSLVQPVRLEADREAKGVQRSAGSLVLSPVTANLIRRRLTKLVRFEKFDKRSDDWVRADCSDHLAKSVMEGVPWEPIPPLSGVVETPTLRDDGTLLLRPGYDERSSILFDPCGVSYPTIREEPSRENAIKALGLLRSVFASFPFVDNASRSVILSACLTAVTRRTLRAAPMFGFSAPKPGSGKSLLAECISYISTGRSPTLMTHVVDADEERKRLTSVLMDGTSVLLIDNVSKRLKSDALCSILSQPTYSDRVLGASRKIIARTNLLVLASGNNLIIEGDLSRRTLIATIDPGVERPEEREFETDLHELIPRIRPKLVAACLTIIRSYLAAGSPDVGVPSYGNFEQWQRWCRHPLVWLGEEDPYKVRDQIEARDESKTRLTALLAAWYELFGSAPMTVGAAVKVEGLPAEKMEPWTEAIETFKAGKEINTRSMGNYLAANERVIMGGLRFERHPIMFRNAVQWKAVPSSQ